MEKLLDDNLFPFIIIGLRSRHLPSITCAQIDTNAFPFHEHLLVMTTFVRYWYSAEDLPIDY